MIPGNQACQSRTPPVPHLLTRRGGGVKGSPFFDTKRLKNYLIARTILFRFFFFFFGISDMHTNTGRVTVFFLDGEAMRKSALGKQRTLPERFGNAYITRRHWLGPLVGFACRSRVKEKAPSRHRHWLCLKGKAQRYMGCFVWSSILDTLDDWWLC